MIKRKIIAYATIAVALAVYAVFHFRLHLPEHERVFLNRLDRAVASGEREIAIKSLTDFEWDEGCLEAISYGENNLAPYYKIIPTLKKELSIKSLVMAGYKSSDLGFIRSTFLGENISDTQNWKINLVNHTQKQIVALYPNINFPMPYLLNSCFSKKAVFIISQ